jgi:hypothetical protein
MPRVDLAAALHIRTDHLGARGAGELGQLCHLLLDQLRRSARKQNADEKRPLSRGPGVDQSLSFLIRAIASSRRASGAVTESLK